MRNFTAFFNFAACVIFIAICLPFDCFRIIIKYHSNPTPVFLYEDIIQIKSKLELSPIVVPEYKLIFVWNSKSGGTYWKKLFQYVQGLNITGLAAHNFKTFD